MAWASTVVLRSSQRTGVRPAASATRAANALYSSALGPSVPSMFRGKPITSSSTACVFASRAISAATASLFRL